jgi:hypothetical protein
MVNGPLTGTALKLISAYFARADARMPREPMIELPHLPNLHGLVELANRDGVDIRPTLLRVMTDLYVQKPKHSEQEERHFTELALRLIELVDAPTRAIVAGKIAGYPTAPAEVRHRLLKDMITLQPAIEAAPAPDDPPAADVPAFAPAAADELSELFLAADAEERRLILLNLPYALLQPAVPIPPAIARESTNRLEAAALGHNTELFARELERTLMISREHARRLIEDASGEPVVVAAVALAMPAAVLQRILLCLNPAISQSVQRVYELALLYEEVEPDAALRLIAIWQANCKTEKTAPAARPTAAHQPQLWPDAKSANASPFTRPKIPWDEAAQARKAEGA